MFADAADGCLSPVAPSSPECTRQTPQSQSTGAPSKAMVHRNEVEELVFQKRRYVTTWPCFLREVNLTARLSCTYWI